MKRLLNSLVFCLLLLLLVSCYAFALDQGTCGNNVSYSVAGDMITFTKTDPASEAFWEKCGSIFQNDSRIKRVKVNDPIILTSGESVFKDFGYVEEMDLSKLDVSSVTDMKNMFSGCSSLSTLNVKEWDTSKVTNMFGMFINCKSLTSLDVSKWNTSNVTDMSSMFAYCYALPSLDVSNWNISNVTSICQMFMYCRQLTTLDVSKWDTSRVTNMKNMFVDCSSLPTLDVSRWKTGSVTDMEALFFGCSSLPSLDLKGWDTSNVTTMRSMFMLCSSLPTIDVSNWKTSNVTSMEGMFDNCSSITTLDVSGWDTSKVTKMSGMFYKCSSLTNLDLSNWDTSNVSEMVRIFTYCDGITRLTFGEKTIETNIFESLPLYNSTWKYDVKGSSASNPLPIGSRKSNGTLFTAYDYDSMAGTWVVTNEPEEQETELHFFPIFPEVRELPGTGFPAGKIIDLPARPQDLVYSPLRMTLQIPVIEMETDLVRIPLAENSWPVDWLDEKAGVLEGSELPGEGYSIIAAHNTLNDTDYGPFARLFEMESNDMIYVRKPDNSLLRFRVYANELILPNDFDTLKLIAEKEADSLILVTCENESMEGKYLNRRAVFAKPAD